jgi:hypothetical protein
MKDLVAGIFKPAPENTRKGLTDPPPCFISHRTNIANTQDDSVKAPYHLFS